MLLFFLHKNLLQNCSYAASFIRHTQISTNFRFYCKNKTPELKQDHIVSLFQSYGFTENQISSLISKKPGILYQHPDPEKTLKPKLDFFNSVGFPPSYLHTILKVDPYCFKLSLEEQIIPSYEYLKSVLHTSENVNFTIKRASTLLRPDRQRYIAQNIDVLRECGVPMDRILGVLKSQPRTIIQKSHKLAEIILKVKDMRFDPQKTSFLAAIITLTGMVGSNWEKKKENYRKWGWSDEDIIAAFQMSPGCMSVSEKKLVMVMEFLVTKMGWSSSEVAEYPDAINHSLKNWTVPRCLVYQFLLSKGLIEKKRLATVISVKKELFIKRLLNPYSARFPELQTMFEPKVEVPDNL